MGLLWLFADIVAEDFQGRSVLHLLALILSFLIVLVQMPVEYGLHVFDGPEPGLAAFDRKCVSSCVRCNSSTVRLGCRHVRCRLACKANTASAYPDTFS